jgi:energy-coupling factor transporter ATP-binding protein EcfA2
VDRREAIGRYIRKNLLKLTSTETTKELEKSIRRSFFEENHLKGNARFSTQEVAEEISKYVIKSRTLSKDEFLNLIFTIPFIRDSIQKQKLEIIYDSNSQKSSLFFSITDLPKLNQEDFLRKIEDEYESRAKHKFEEEVKLEKDEIEKIKSELSKKKEELQKFESELNKLPPNLGTEELEMEVEKVDPSDLENASTSWWKRLGFPQNPFETNQGLSGISENRYEDVIVKTPLVREYSKEFSNNPEIFSGKTIMLIGDFGSGKTTIFQYLSYLATAHGLLPLLIILNPTQSVSTLTDVFLEEVIESLSESFVTMRKYDPRSERPTGNISRYALELFKELQKESPHGFLVFIDGLHKSDAYLPQVLEFLKQIQNIQEYISTKGVKIGFFIAGSPLWESELERKPSLSGSYYRKDNVPVLTEEYAVEAIEKRISLYPSGNIQPITIDKSALRQTFKVLSERLKKGVTFRDFLDHIRERLEVNQFEEIGLSVRIHIETVDAVRASLRTTSLANNINALLNEIVVSPQLRIASQKITPFILKSGVSEDQAIFKSNRGVFYLLMKYDIIVQRKVESGVSFRWYFSSEFINTLIGISQRLKLTPYRILAAMFEEETLTKEQETTSIYASSVNLLRDLVSTWKDSFPNIANLLSQCKEGIIRINQHMKAMDTLQPTDLANPIMNIVRSLDSIMNFTRSGKNDFEVFANSWVAPENIDKIREFSDNNIIIPKVPHDIYGLLHNHNKYIFQLLNLLSDIIKGESIVRLVNRKLSSARMQSIHELRMRFLSQAYEEVINGVCLAIEKTLRDVIYYCMRALWGNNSFQILPDDVRKRIQELPERGHTRTRRDSDINFLYDVSRSEYSKILFMKDISRGLFSDWMKSNDLENLKYLLELSFSLDDRRSHRDREEYFRAHATEILDILKGLPWVLEKFHELIGQFFFESEISLNSSDTELHVQFKPFMQGSSKTIDIVVEKKTVKEISQKILELLADRNQRLDITAPLFVEISYEPELFLAVFRALLLQKFVEPKINKNLLTVISITQKGRDWLSNQNHFS